jgi:hypothetical protein
MAVNLCCGNYRQALAQSLHFDQLGPQAAPLLDLSAQRLRVLAQHFAGNQALAQHNAEQVIQRMAHSGHLNRFTHGFGVQYDQSVASLTILARILWLRGFPERAWRTANQALELALQINHGTSICYTLALAGVVIARYNGDATSARSLLDLLMQQAQKHSVQLFHTWARHYAGTAPEQDMHGLGLVADTLVTFNARAVDAAMFERARNGAAGWCTAEILRVHAEHIDDPQAAEALLLDALGLAHQQGALAWELRSATALARLWQRQDRRQAARELLNAVYARFTEGFATQDLIGVRRLLDELQDKRPT